MIDDDQEEIAKAVTDRICGIDYSVWMDMILNDRYTPALAKQIARQTLLYERFRINEATKPKGEIAMWGRKKR